MTPAKRGLDLALALGLAVPAAPLLGLLLALLWLREGRPLFHVSERMGEGGRPFRLVKLRTMRPADSDSGVSGGDKAARITPTGARLRRARLDELPQLWNIARGEMSFVGPRPPLRQYVERFPELYARVLVCRPGITGLATLVHHAHEERLLARARTAAETDAIYARACVPRKGRLDLIYRRRRTLCLDLVLMGRTLARLAPGASPRGLRPEGSRPEGDRPEGGAPRASPRGERAEGDRPEGDRPEGGAPKESSRRDRAEGDRAEGGVPKGVAPKGARRRRP